MIFEDCVIPAENLLGKEGDGFIDAMRVLDGGRISIAALSLGMAQGAYEAALKYSKERQAIRQGDRRIPGDPVEAGRHGYGD
jgi:alkylation response protein AidB-like acyl-CoA dehydrogenase